MERDPIGDEGGGRRPRRRDGERPGRCGGRPQQPVAQRGPGGGSRRAAGKGASENPSRAWCEDSEPGATGHPLLSMPNTFMVTAPRPSWTRKENPNTTSVTRTESGEAFKTGGIYVTTSESGQSGRPTPHDSRPPARVRWRADPASATRSVRRPCGVSSAPAATGLLRVVCSRPSGRSCALKHARVAVRPQAGQPSVSRAPKVCLAISSARAWPTTVPVTSGCSRAQVRAEAVLVKKLRASQQTVAAGPEQPRRPTNTTAPRGSQTVVRSGWR